MCVPGKELDISGLRQACNRSVNNTGLYMQVCADLASFPGHLGPGNSAVMKQPRFQLDCM